MGVCEYPALCDLYQESISIPPIFSSTIVVPSDLSIAVNLALSVETEEEYQPPRAWVDDTWSCWCTRRGVTILWTGSG